MNNKKIVTLKVNGIHCEGCALKIKKNLDLLNMDHIVDVDVQNGKVKVIFDPTKASLADIKSNITTAGYQVENVELE